MNKVAQIFTLCLVLVGVYLFLSHGGTTVSIIKELGSATNTGFKTLQGRG